MASAIARFIASPEQLAGLRIAALAQAQCFSWDETARQTLAIYDEATSHAPYRHPRAEAEGMKYARGGRSWR